MEKNAVETRTARLWMGEDGILRVVNKPGVEMDLAAAEENVTTGARLSHGRKVPILINLGTMRSMSKEARDYLAGEKGAQATQCQALVVNNPIGKVIGNFFLGLNKPSFPIKLFTSEEAAIEWLRGFVE